LKKRKPSPRHGRRPAFKKPFSPKQNNTPKIPDFIDVEITGLTEDGEPFGQTADRRLRGHFPRILFAANEPVGVGQVIPCTLTQAEGGTFTAKPETPQVQDHKPLIGEVRLRRRDWKFIPFDRQLSNIDFTIPMPPRGLQANQVVLAKVGHRPSAGATPVEITKILGDDSHGLENEIAIYNHGLPLEFPKDVLAEAEKLPAKLTKKELEEREDLRKMPIVTIDGEDAKDYDDAVWAEKTEHGYHIIVAIADVAHYIKSGGALDEEALQRGNSTYFPGKVIPMLPERISNDLCSLLPQVDRPTLAVHMWIDLKGKLVKHRFVRAVIHSAARLTYTQVQAALEGTPDATTKPLLKTTLQPLYEAYKILISSRAQRGAIDLDVAEPYLHLNDDGSLLQIGARNRQDSHRLIEEMMILANVAAATSLEKAGSNALFRVHPEPGSTKFERLRTTLKSHNIKIEKSGKMSPHFYQNLANKLRKSPASAVLMQAMLQSQEQARYDKDNIGHFGLALARYSHFTSPIRRYSDLVVHRALIKGLKLAGDGGKIIAPGRLDMVSEQINTTERRSQRAEWEARDRIISSFYEDKIGTHYEATVISVQPFGLFVQLSDQVSEGLIPLRLMHDDHYRYDGTNGQLRGSRSKRVIKIGTQLNVELTAADHISGQLTFGLQRNSRPKRPRPLS
jgi:ribonuclease R